MRQREADIARRRILDPVEGAPAGRDRSTPRSKHLIVIATQTLEVGADLDFDVLVTESCGVRAFVQRLGRLNRLGECQDAKAVVVPAAKATTWPVYGEEPAELWSRLEAAADEGGLVDLAPARIGDVVGIPDDRPPRTPELLPAHLWEWAKTTVPPPGEAPVELFFEGFSSEGPRVTLCWRATRLPEGARLVPSIHSDETIDVPLNEAKGALENVLGENGELIRLSRDRVTVEQASVRDLRPSDIVVLNTSDGLYDEHGWAPESRREVLDVSLVHWPGLPLDVETLRHWFADSASFGEVTLLVKQVRAGEDDLDLSEAAAQLVALSPELECRSELIDDWGALRPTLQPVIDFSGDLPILQRRLTPVVRRASQLLAADAFDDLSATVRSVRLDDHLASVAELAARLGQAVGLSPELVRAVEAAGRFHDLGKADPRFQLWLSAGSPTGELLAKSASPRWRWRAARELSGWPRGGRHEALSARLVEEWLADHRDPPWDADLVLHLVLSHHGFGRPLVAPVADTTATRCEANIGGVAVSVCGDLSETDWDQPSRFRRCCEKYGYWGLALLEAIVRQADHLASSQAAEVPLEVA
jgi:CRISPR-associated endonuclease/helicase Cas3